ncbi:MAG: SGNH/GDSL hydrolase family protein [Betaproteobacteria bacterium]
MSRLLSSLGIIFVSAAVAVAGFEGLLRLTDYSAPVWYQPDARLGWRLRPNLRGTFTFEGRAHVSINSAGFRDREHALEKPAGAYRIAVLGDSYSEALQVPLHAAYWARLPALLAACGYQRGRDIEALNFGVAGFGTAQQLLLLESVALRYRPDLVLLQFTNGNDVRNNSFALEEDKLRPFFTLDSRGRLHADNSFAHSEAHARRSSLSAQALRALSDHSRVVQLLRAVSQAPLLSHAHAGADGVEAGLESAVLAAPRSRLWEDAWRVTEALIERTRELAAANGAGFLLVTVPYAVQVHPDPAVREPLQKKLGVPDLLYPDRRLAAFAAGQGIPALVLAPEMLKLAEARRVALHGFENAQPGFGHWNEHGHRVAAELIAQKLCGGKQGQTTFRSTGTGPG